MDLPLLLLSAQDVMLSVKPFNRVQPFSLSVQKCLQLEAQSCLGSPVLYQLIEVFSFDK